MTLVALRDFDPRYPMYLRERLQEAAPSKLMALGNPNLLALRKTALFGSARCPGYTILVAHDQAARWRDEGRCVIGGFHSPVEKECLRILLRGRQPVICCLARGLEGIRLPTDWKTPLADGRLLILSPFPAFERRVTHELAISRNQIVAAIADEVAFVHITPGGHLDKLRQLIIGWSVPHVMVAPRQRLSS